MHQQIHPATSKTPQPPAAPRPRNGVRIAAVPTPCPGLVYSCDTEPGIRRRRRGRGFAYLQPDGRQVTDGDVLARIRKLAIPPAWADVWICTASNGHLQATGRDARGRKQYRYHAQWREHRDAGKFQSLLAFGEALPKLRRQVDRELARPGLGRDKVLAILVRLLELTMIRVGNREYARSNGSYGLTTLLDQHVEAVRGRLRFRFRAKGGQEREVELGSKRLCRLVRRCQELPGQTLFQYRDDEGVCQPVTSAQVNAYLRERTGQAFTAKHFRTWAATVMAYSTLVRSERPDSIRGRRKLVTATMREVGRFLGNTPTVCRTSYVHPEVVSAFESGELAGREVRDSPTWHQAEEETLEFLRSRTRRRAALSPRARARPGSSPASAPHTGASRAA